MNGNLCKGARDKAFKRMHDQHGTKGKWSRRDFLKTGVLSLGVAALGGLPRQGLGQAPAVIKGTKLFILQGT